MAEFFLTWTTYHYISATLALVSVSVLVYNSFIKDKFLRNKLQKKAIEFYRRDQVKEDLKYYIKPDCCSADPSHADEMREQVLAREPIFKNINRFLKSKRTYQHLLILADSGMGKTSFLLNYSFNNFRRWFHKDDIVLLPLSVKGIDDELSKVRDPKKTVVFLDAFDEDHEALHDNYKERLLSLVEKTQHFKKIIITCRSQFFESEEVIPKETGIVVLGPRPIGKTGTYELGRLYIAPFTDQQVQKYLRRKFSIFRYRKRVKAQQVVQKIPYLTIRPMVLTHIGDFLDEYKDYNYQKDLYEKIVTSWVARESHWYKQPQDLIEFSKKLSIKLIYERRKRGGEYIPYEELKIAADAWGIELDKWQISGKSLLNRNAVNFKFSHRSILEYFFVRSFLELPVKQRLHLKWSDQMKLFLKEILLDEKPKNLSFIDCRGLSLDGIDFSKADLTNANFGSSKLTKCDFSRSNCKGANFSISNLAESNLTDANFTHSCFSKSQLANCSFEKSLFGGSIFVDSTMDKVDYQASRFQYAYFENSIITNGLNLQKHDELMSNVHQGRIKTKEKQ